MNQIHQTGVSQLFAFLTILAATLLTGCNNEKEPESSNESTDSNKTTEKQSPFELGFTAKQWINSLRSVGSSKFVDLDDPFPEKSTVFKGETSSSIKIVANKPPRANTLWRAHLVIDLEEFTTNEKMKQKFISMVGETAKLINPSNSVDFGKQFAKARHQSFCKVMIDETTELSILYNAPPDKMLKNESVLALFKASYAALREKGILDDNYDTGE